MDAPKTKPTYTIICQHTGIEFQALSKRALNHPEVAKVLDEARKSKPPGLYAEVCRQFAACKAEGMADINEIIAVVNEELAAFQRGQNAKALERYRVERARREESKRREYQNNFLYRHGYKWHREAVGTEEDALPGSYGAGIGELSHYAWSLAAPDGRTVTVERALDEINRGADVVAAEERAAAETAAKAKAEVATAEAAVNAVWDAAWALTEVEDLDDNGAAIIAADPSGRRVVKATTINGVECRVTISRNAVDGDFHRYWCADPDRAGLKPLVRSGLSQTFADFFGG